MADIEIAALEEIIESVMSRKLEAMSDKIEAMSDKIEAAMSDKIEAMSDDIKGDIKAMNSRLDYVERTMEAINTRPEPYGRPKTFQTATEFHSVSAPIRKYFGHMG
ncbi:hypothetical protein ACO0LM_22255 [Undibacterium sp. Di26W]|uniref:hypothetical protein n=1 Tax=Undibacterium sp. Di26W TaxID=3413035 RepID=UPI003BF02CCE